MWNSKFGYIYLTKNGDTDNNSPERIACIDIDYIMQQAYEYGSSESCHIRTDNGFCQSAFSVKETPVEILELIRKHDEENALFVREFAKRNGFMLVKGETW